MLICSSRIGKYRYSVLPFAEHFHEEFLFYGIALIANGKGVIKNSYVFLKLGAANK